MNKTTIKIISVVIFILIAAIVMLNMPPKKEGYKSFIERTGNPEGFTLDQYKEYRK